MDPSPDSPGGLYLLLWKSMAHGKFHGAISRLDPRGVVLGLDRRDIGVRLTLCGPLSLFSHAFECATYVPLEDDQTHARRSLV